MGASESTFQSYKSKRILSFTNLICFSFQTQRDKKTVSAFCHTVCYSEKLWTVSDIVKEKCKVFVQKSLLLKNCFARRNSQTLFCCLCVNLPTVKIWGQPDKFSRSFSSLQCPLQVKKLIRKNFAKYVNQTGKFYFRPKLKIAISLPIINLFP